MKEPSKNNHNTIAACMHLLTFGKWLFPLGNFALPIILWVINSKKSEFIDYNGREAINFQISITLYTVILALVGGSVILGTMISGGPMFWEAIDDNSFFFTDNMGIFSTIMASGVICGTAILVLAIIDLVCTIKATIKSINGEYYQYPLTINFIPNNLNNEPLNDTNA